MPPQETGKDFFQIEKEMKERGFEFAGIEDFSKTEHSPGADSVIVAQSREDIIRDYRNIHKLWQDPRKTEVELVDRDPQSVYVFVKKIEGSNWREGDID